MAQFIFDPSALCSTQKSFSFRYVMKSLCFLISENYKTRRKVTFPILFVHPPFYVQIFPSPLYLKKFLFYLLAFYSDATGL